MKKIWLSLFVLFFLVGSFIWFDKLFASSGKVSEQKLLAPQKDSLVLGANLWFPQEATVNLSDAPQITAKGAYFIDAGTGQVLFKKAEHARLPIASLTKVMTVIITLENKRPEDEFRISQRAADMEPDKMLLKAGETLTTQELLDGIFLVSANDAAETLAEGVFGQREVFIDQMNKKAKLLGLNDSLFINPTGLEEDGRGQYSSAYDLALMSRYAIQRFPFLLDISSAEHIYLPQTPNHQDYDLYSGINLLTTYPGVVGFKTGFTPEAGLTLITMARRERHLIIGVILGSGDRRGEARELLDYSFKKLGVKL